MVNASFSAGAAIGGIGAALKDLFHVDDESIDAILNALTDGLHDLPKNVAGVDAPAFGSLHNGQQMGFHTTNARAFMVQTVHDLHALLVSRAEDVEAFAKDSEDLDFLTAVNLWRLRSAVEDSTPSTGDES